MPPRRKVRQGASGAVLAIEVGGCFDRIDGREEVWWFSSLPESERAGVAPFRTPRFHRTLSEWVAMFTDTGSVIEAVGEPQADAATARAEPIVADSRDHLFAELRGPDGKLPRSASAAVHTQGANSPLLRAINQSGMQISPTK